MTSVLALLARGAADLDDRTVARYLDAFPADPGREAELWTEPGLALAARRRPTTPEAEREPFPVNDAAGELLLAWDGRLDNREQLAQALRLDGRTARELSDGDYVLTAYRRWGDEAFPRLVGDWAIVIWDARARRLTAAKDPLGWRPLFFRVDGGLVALASDPRQLLARDAAPEPNRDYLLRYLADAERPAHETAYEGLFELGGGELLSASGGALSVRRYWDAPEVRERRYSDPMEYVEEFEALVAQATRAQLRANGRVGVLLSGGLDSSYVAMTAARSLPELRAISSFAPGTSWDERAHQRSVVERAGLDYRPFDVSDCWALNREYADLGAFDIPETPPQHALMVRTAQAASEAGVEVVLSGIGGDEWLSGDETFIADALLRGQPRRAHALARDAAPNRAAARTLAVAAYRGLLPRRARSGLGRLANRRSWDGLLPLVEARPGWEGRESRTSVVAWRRDKARRRRMREYRQRAAGAISWNERHAQRPNGVELRSPLNDLRVVEFLASVPEWVKRFQGRPKAILRAALQRAGLPASIYDRKDKGSYDEPYEHGLCELERDRVEEALDAVCALPGVRAERARSEAEQWLEARHPRWEATWRLISAGLWLQHVDALRSEQVDPFVELAPEAVRPGRQMTPLPVRRTTVGEEVL